MPPFEQIVGQTGGSGENERSFSEGLKLRQTLDVPEKLLQLLMPEGARLADKTEEPELVVLEKDARHLELFIVVKAREEHAERDQAFTFDEAQKAAQEVMKTHEGLPLLYVQLGRMNNQPGTLVIYTFEVHPDFQGQKIGSDFKERLEIMARSLGFKQIVSEAANKDVARFNRRLGYRPATGSILKEMKNQGIFDEEGAASGKIPMVKDL